MNGGKQMLMVGNFLSAHGKSRGICEDLSIRLASAGWEVFATSRQPNKLLRLLDMLYTTWLKRREYRLAQVDVYSGAAFIWAELVCLLLKLMRKPFVLSLHGGSLPSFASRFPSRVRRLLSTATVVTTPSSYLKEKLRHYRDDLLIVPNSIDLSAYNFRPRREPKARLIWLRAFQQIYNPPLAPKVIKNLTSEFPDIQLIMIGQDKGDGSLQLTKHLTATLGLESQITFHDNVPKSAVPAWLNKGDIFINTTNVDNTPVSLIEAMACGLCVVSTNVGGIPYLTENEHEVLLVPPDDAEAMSRVIRRILTEPGLAERLSRNARKKAEQFDWDVIQPLWEALFVNCTDKRRRAKVDG